MPSPYLAWLLAAGAALAPAPARASQEPLPPPAQPSAPPKQPAGEKPRKQIHADELLIKGTVFTLQGLSLPGAELRIRRAGEKKFRWQTLSDRRGEFAVWVPLGAGYELVVRARGFEQQNRPVDARSGARQEDVVFRMKPASGRKTK